MKMIGSVYRKVITNARESYNLPEIKKVIQIEGLICYIEIILVLKIPDSTFHFQFATLMTTFP